MHPTGRMSILKKSIVVGNSKTLEPLGDFVFTPLEDGLAKTISYYQSLIEKNG